LKKENQFKHQLLLQTTNYISVFSYIYLKI
jgi:hypothetical protein